MSVKGVDNVIANLRAVGADVEDAISKSIRATAFNVQGKAVKSIQSEVSQGKEYNRGKKTHVASKAGDAPNTDTGRLAGSILTRIEFEVAWVYTNLDYGAYLEFGTTTIDPRPWLAPALNDHQDFYFKHLQKQAAAALL